MHKKKFLLLFFIILTNIYFPQNLNSQQEKFSWNDIKNLIRNSDLSYEKKVEMIKTNGFNCDSTFPDDYPIKLIQIEKNKLIIDAIIEEINKCKKTLTIITKPVNAAIYVDREKKGESNNSGIFDIKVKPGKYSIKVSKEGYYDSAATVMIDWQEKTEIFELKTRLYSLTFNIKPQDAEIYIMKENNSFKNKKLFIKDNVLTNLKLGEYLFKIKKEGFISKEQTIYLNKDDIIKINLDKKIIPLPPENIRSEIFNNAIKITWDKALNATKYILYYSESENVIESNDFIITEATSYTIKGLERNKKYFFGVIGLSEECEESEIGQIINATEQSETKQRPVPPPNKVKIFSGINFAFIEWDKVESAVFYNLYYKEGDFDTTGYKNWNGQKIDNIHSLSKTIENLKSGGKYSFAVTTVTNTGESDFSNIVTTVIPDKFETPFLGKNFWSLEYLDAIRITNSEKITDNININYVAKFIKGNYDFNKTVSLFIKTGIIKFGLINESGTYEYGKDSFVYGGGIKLNILPQDNINLDIKLDFLNSNNIKDISSEQSKREIKWKEYQTGFTSSFYNNSIYSPYIGINYLMINGELNYSFGDVIENKSYAFKEDKKSVIEYFLGIKIKGKTYFFDFFDSEISLLQTLNNYSFRIGLGKFL